MKKTIVEIYALAVCFFSVACLVIVLGIAIWGLIEVACPEFTVSGHTYEKHQSNDAFLGRHNEFLNLGKSIGINVEDIDTSALTQEEISQSRKRSWDRALSGEIISAAQSLARNVIIMLISIVIIWVHWGIARRAREPNS